MGMDNLTRERRLRRLQGALAPLWNLFTAAKKSLASSSNTKANVLTNLAIRGNKAVQERVAENTSTDSLTLEWLAKHEDSVVRSAVAQNDSTPSATASRLSDDHHCDVRYAMAENPKTDEAILEKLTNDTNPYVQDRAKRTQARLRDQDNSRSDEGQ